MEQGAPFREGARGLHRTDVDRVVAAIAGVVQRTLDVCRYPAQDRTARAAHSVGDPGELTLQRPAPAGKVAGEGLLIPAQNILREGAAAPAEILHSGRHV